MHERQRLGAAGEDLAAAHLTAAGLDLRHRNWRAAVDGVRGELDLVAADGDVLAVVEVRTRRVPRGLRAGEGEALVAGSVGRAKRRQLRRLTALYLQAHPHPGPVRGDVVTVVVADRIGDDRTRVEHLRGVW
jgi:putative endonuclease